MTHLEILHLEAIKKSMFKAPYSPSFISAASKSAEITEQIAIEFARWCDKKELSDNHITWEDWFNEFLKSKEQ